METEKFLLHTGGIIEVPTFSGKVMAYRPPLQPSVDTGRLASRL